MVVHEVELEDAEAVMVTVDVSGKEIMVVVRQRLPWHTPDRATRQLSRSLPFIFPSLRSGTKEGRKADRRTND